MIKWRVPRQVGKCCQRDGAKLPLSGVLNGHQQQLATHSLTLKVLADGQLLDVQLIVDLHRPQKTAKLLISVFGHPHQSAADCLQVLFGVGHGGIGKPGEGRVYAKQFGGRTFDGGEGGGITVARPAYNKTHGH
ncbi:hypothetical protein EMIT0215P_90060 [Pseudomonas serboccidentalis]